MASSKETYCLCGQPYNIGQFMIECDCCREWFHGSCVDVKIYHSDDIDKYHCPKCAQTYGPSVLKIPTNNHRADRYELSAETRPSQVGTPAWVRALAARPPRPHASSLTRMLPQHFTEDFVRDDGFNRPVLFTSQDGLEMKTPNPQTFTVRSVLRFCGAQLEVEVIDVRKQSTLRMPLIDFVDYFETPPEHRDEKVLNVLSLEFSDTNMCPLVEPPGILKRMDWAEVVWPAAEARPPRPAVQRYCLMSAAGSYTDFHVDFGGTTVWYHVLHGRKTFYLIPPTSTNLALYQQWSSSNNQNERFFGDMVEWYGTVELMAGQTLFIPSGWIHAVLTPCDSLVFGGNLLHSYAIEMQLQIYEIERRVETPTAFRYPLFETMHWYAGAHLLTLLRRHNEETQDEDFTISEYPARAPPQALPALLLRGVKILSNALKEWHALKSTDVAKRDVVPACLNSGQLVRELCKELRTLEKRCANAARGDKDVKIKSVSPKKASSKSVSAKKSLKLTLPKPIMHNTMGQNGDFVEDKVYTEEFYIDNKEVVYPDNRYIAADPKYLNGIPENKDLVYTNYQEVPDFQEQFVDRSADKKSVLRMKMNASPTNTLGQPPPYPLPEHSILKSHLVRGGAGLKQSHQWSISKKDIGDYHEEQQLLYTNDNVAQGIDYGPGMYSAEDIQQEYEYVPAGKATGYDYGYATAPYTETYQPNYIQTPAPVAAPRAPQVPVPAYSTEPAVAVPQEPLNGSYNQLPSYDAAIAQSYQTPTTDYVIEEQKPSVVAVRRSERGARRRVSNTYDYEDGDLYIESPPPPPPRRSKPRARFNKGKHGHRHTASNSGSSQYRSGAVHTKPANGIESLIQASVLAEEEPPANDTEDAAVEGMLSISSRYSQPLGAGRTFGLPASAPEPTPGQGDSTPATGSRSRRRAAASSADEDLSAEEDVIKEVHRDEEYVYPSLEMSSDEDEEWQASRRKPSRSRHDSRSKGDKDESWSPRARLGRLVPLVRGPARAGVRRECVRAALSHAASHGPKAHPPRTKEKEKPAVQNAKRAVLESKSRRPPPAPAPSHNKNIRLKKGMKTAKQRLGKILKIHKMIY